MSKVKSISLYHFKNYEQQSFLFEKDIVCLVGQNGVGKTTILDAIYFLCFTKSYFVSNDVHCIKNGTQGMYLKGIFENINDFEIKCIIRENNKKEFYCDDEIYLKLSNHIGKFSCVMIAPDDTELITEGSEFRRKFIDGIIAQIDQEYLLNLTSYNKTLQQRNAYLKQCKGILPQDLSLLHLYNEQLDMYSKNIVLQRVKFIEILKRNCNEIYKLISNDVEFVDVQYETKLIQKSLLDLLNENILKDILSARTNYGIHKDEILFSMNQIPLKQVASQGQRKSFLFGLKLAQYEILKNNLFQNPILLLDDIFEKLDENRSQKLIEYIVNLNTQIFVTDTHFDRVQTSFCKSLNNIQLININ